METRLPYQRHSSLSSSPVIAGQSQSALLSRILSCVASTLHCRTIQPWIERTSAHPKYWIVNIWISSHGVSIHTPRLLNCGHLLQIVAVSLCEHGYIQIVVYPYSQVQTSWHQNCYQSANIVGQLQSQSKGTLAHPLHPFLALFSNTTFSFLICFIQLYICT